MKLYFNGCSTTAGHELPDETRLQTSWAGLVAAHYKAESKNDATNGGTTDRIVSRTMQHINDYDKFYIQWTFAERFTLHDQKNWFEVNFQERLIHDHYRKKDYFLNFGKLYYTHWSSSLFEFKKWLEQIILLQNFFKQHNKRYLMFCVADNDYQIYCGPRNDFVTNLSKIIDITEFSDEQMLAQYDQIHTLLKLIDFGTFIPPSIMYANQWRKDFKSGPGGHILEDGHAHLARYIIEHESNTKSK
jgi:hypothetical protein